MSTSEGIEKLAAKELRQDFDGEQVFAPGRDPAVALLRQTAAGDDAMKVGMEGQLSRPGMKHGGDAQLAAQSLFILAQRQQRVGGTLKQEVV
jgi:hypothetical protein